MFVTTSRCPKWVICVPAAFLGSGRRFSGGLSRIEPRFSVIRQRHGWRRANRRQHDRSETRRWRRRLEAMRSAAITRVSSTDGRPKSPDWFSPNKCALPRRASAPSRSLVACISTGVTARYPLGVSVPGGIVTDLMSRPQSRRLRGLYLDLHGLIFETSI